MIHEFSLSNVIRKCVVTLTDLLLVIVGSWTHFPILRRTVFLVSWWLLSYFFLYRRPSAKCLLESQYFPPSIRSAYLFLAPLQLIAKPESRIQYAAKIANKGGLKVMGAFTAEMCAPYCLSLIMSSSSDVEAESALFLLKELLRCLSSRAIVALILPAIQKILQAS